MLANRFKTTTSLTTKMKSKHKADIEKQFAALEDVVEDAPAVEECLLYIYGPAKVGKTTFAANNTAALFLATEPGMRFVRAKRVSVSGWDSFLEVLDILEVKGTAVAAPGVKTLVVDTVDNLWQFCFKYVCERRNIEYPATNDYGKDWDAIKREWGNAITRLCSLGVGVWFIGHAVDKEVKLEGEVMASVRSMPMLPRTAYVFLNMLSDIILSVEIKPVKGLGGKIKHRRIMRTVPTGNLEGGGSRCCIADELPLEYSAFIEAYNRANNRHK